MKTNAAKNRLIADDDEDPVPPHARIVAPSAADGVPFPEDRKPQIPRRRAGGRGGAYPGRRQVNAYVEDRLFLYLKAISAQHRKSMVEIFEEALRAYVNSHDARRRFGAPPG